MIFNPRIIAANGPKMLALADDIADGAMPAMLPAEFTAQARQLLGPDKLLVVGLSVVGDLDAERAKTAAREAVSARVSTHIGLPAPRSIAQSPAMSEAEWVGTIEAAFCKM